MTEEGWPFLIGAGRRHEYRTLLAPRFLVTANEYGLLDRHAGRLPEGETRVVQAGPGVWLAYRSYAVPDARDEHNRPLRVLAGFVSRSPIGEPDPADLAVGLDAAMPVYRRYLEAEDDFGVLPSDPFPLRGAAVPAERPVPSRAYRLIAMVAAVAVAALTVLVIVLTHGSADQPCTEPSATTATTPQACPISEAP